VKDYLPIHAWFDESKAFFPDFRHRALRHHAEGIFLAEKLFGVAIVKNHPPILNVRTRDDGGDRSERSADEYQVPLRALKGFISPRVRHRLCAARSGHFGINRSRVGCSALDHERNATWVTAGRDIDPRVQKTDLNQNESCWQSRIK
jgi:hypothetical protein